MKYHFIRMIDVKMIIVDATRSNIDDNVICFSYLVARLCMVERVDLVDPERIKLILFLNWLMCLKNSARHLLFYSFIRL